MAFAPAATVIVFVAVTETVAVSVVVAVVVSVKVVETVRVDAFALTVIVFAEGVAVMVFAEGVAVTVIVFAPAALFPAAVTVMVLPAAVPAAVTVTVFPAAAAFPAAVTVMGLLTVMEMVLVPAAPAGAGTVIVLPGAVIVTGLAGVTLVMYTGLQAGAAARASRMGEAKAGVMAQRARADATIEAFMFAIGSAGSWDGIEEEGDLKRLWVVLKRV